MTLRDLIALLESVPSDRICRHAFASPHSWRGDYMDLAFEPAENRTVGEMLADARSALGTRYQGYKGGYFTMGEHTDVHVERYGTAEDLLPEYGMRWILASGKTA